MKRLLSVAVLMAVVLSYSPVYAQIAVAPERKLSELTVPELAQHFATVYGVSATKMLNTMKCESGFNPLAEGDNHKSIGIAQINLPAHPEITKAQAQQPVFATEFMAKEFSKGNARIWTCARILGYTK